MQAWVIFGRCFRGGQADEVMGCARAYGLFDVWKASVEVFCECLPCTCPEALMIACNQLMLSCLHALLQQKEGNPEFLTPVSDCNCLAKATVMLLQYCHKKANLATAVLPALFMKSICECCQQPTDKLMLGALTNELVVRKLLPVPNIAVVSQPPAIVKKTLGLAWNLYTDDKGDQLTFFADDLCKALPGVKTPRLIISMVRNKDDNLKVIVPDRHLPAVLVLCDLMVKAGRLSCKGSRGYMQFLGNHIVAPEGEEKYNIELFRLKKSRALAQESEKLTIKKQIKDLFFKYCTGEGAKKIFENYFSQRNVH